MGDAGARYVLVVDDLDEQREIYRAILLHAGLHVLEAADGETAVHLARAHLPDVVLLDVALPGLDGLAVIRLMKADPRTRRIPIVLLTAATLPDDDGGGYEELLSKPVPPRDALEAVNRQIVLSRNGARAS
jgi:CheY-like chemotaxis protein